MRKQIEGAFPLREINRSAMNDRAKKEHPGNIHLWWNRSPIASSAELLKATLTDEAGERISDGSDVTITDPFSGSGCLTMAALESDVPVLAGDLNAVAAVITKAVAEIPARLKDKAPVSPDAPYRIYSGTAGLTEDVRCYGAWIRKELATRLAATYPDAVESETDGRQVYAWLWTRTAPCPNPACRCRMPLASSYVLSKTNGHAYHVQPVLNGDEISFETLPGAPEEALAGNKIGKIGAQFQCPKCGTVTKDAYIKSVSNNGQLGIQLMAVGYVNGKDRIYCAPDEKQLAAAMPAISKELPVGELPDNTRWFSPPLFGLKNYADLYTPRQMLLMTTLCDLVKEAQEHCLADARHAGFADDGISLSSGGTGALAYSQAIGVYLALVVGKLANFQSELCTWDNRKGNLRAAFTRQAIPMTWTFAEGNPFSTVTGNFDTMLADVVSTIEHLPVGHAANVIQCDARKFPFPPNSVLFTELPYYDNVGYADLSDYFYIWLRRCLKDTFPEMFDKVVSSKEELSSIPEHYDNDPQKAIAAYEDGIHQFFQSFSEHASSDVPSVVFFEFGKKDIQAMENGDGSVLSPWENILDAIVSTGLQVTAVLPVRTEMPNDRYETVRVAIVFRKMQLDAPKTMRRAAVGELKRDLPTMLEERFQADLDDWDRPVVGMGCGLAMMTRYSSIMNADGSTMGIHDALQVIWAEVNEYLRTAVTVGDQSNIEEERHAGEL